MFIPNMFFKSRPYTIILEEKETSKGIVGIYFNKEQIREKILNLAKEKPITLNQLENAFENCGPKTKKRVQEVIFTMIRDQELIEYGSGFYKGGKK